jgi:uncharacterized membrane protein (UPF0127 family)
MTPLLELGPPCPHRDCNAATRVHAVLATLVLATLLFACSSTVRQAYAQSSGERVAPNPRLEQIDIKAGMHLIKAEVAADGPTRSKGLMMRERLGANEGMIFIFPDKAGHCFWMRNTLVALSIAFLDDDGTITNIEDMKPQTEDSHCPVRAVRYALEMEQGWFARRGVKAGARLVQPQLFGSAVRN